LNIFFLSDLDEDVNRACKADAIRLLGEPINAPLAVAHAPVPLLDA
jgi:hypothetical protein